MKKHFLQAALLITSITFLMLSVIVFFGNYSRLSNKKQVYLHATDLIIASYQKEILKLENKVYTSIRTEAIQDFFHAVLTGRSVNYTISFSDPFLINFYLLDTNNQVAYAYSPISSLVTNFPEQSGITLLDQETLAITALLPQSAKGERIIFIFNLRKLMKELFAFSIDNFNESNLTVYRYAFIYTVRKDGTKESFLRDIEILVDNSYEHYGNIVYEETVNNPNKLTGKKLENGLLIGIFYASRWGNIPLISWIVLGACLLIFFILSAYTVFYDYDPIGRLRRPLFFVFFRQMKRFGKHHEPAAKQTESLKQTDEITTIDKKAILDKPHSKLNTEIVSLLSDLEHPTSDMAETPRLSSEPTHSNTDTGVVANVNMEAITASSTSPIEQTSSDPSLKQIPRLHRLNYKTILKILRDNTKEFLGPKHKLVTLRQLTKLDFQFILILEKPATHLPFEVDEFHGVDFSTAQQLIISETDIIFTKFLVHEKAIFIQNAHEGFFGKRLTLERLTYLRNIDSLLIVPFKPKQNVKIKTLVLFG